MESVDHSSIDSESALNERLKNLHHDSYDLVKFLGIYWKDGDKMYEEESKVLKNYFEETFGYTDGDLFPIPTQDSDLELGIYIKQYILTLNKTMSDRRSGLLIIHYGGHGDENADETLHQKQRSVWAAFKEGGPTVQWFEIHPSLARAKVDVLLILDCCCASQVARERRYEDDQENVIVILAAVGMGGRTPKPGPTSFTRAIMKECELLLREKPFLLVSKLHERLGDRKAKLIESPIIINPAPTTIKLQHIASMIVSKEPPDSTMFFRIDHHGITLGQSFEEQVDSIAQWLGRNVPPSIASITVLEMARTTKQASQLLTDVIAIEAKPVLPTSTKTKKDIVQAWDSLVDVLTDNQLVSAGDSLQVLEERAITLLKRLDQAKSNLLEVVADHVTTEIPGQILPTDSVDHSEILRSLMLRRTMQHSQPLAMGFEIGQDRFLDRPKILEFKTYRDGLDKCDLVYVKSLVEKLTGILASQKPQEFRSLPFSSWNHEESHHRIVFKFDIPLEYDTSRRWVSLREAIRITRKLHRPTLEERLTMGLAIVMAVYNWHMAGWVHQSIESHDILLFYKYQEERLDYSSPFLGGFEFARPSQAPSLGSYVQDLERDVYRHPKRQGPSRDGHKKRHDLHSLGVVLLELGLWQDAKQVGNPEHLKDLGVDTMVENLKIAAAERLTFYAGTAYTDAVLRCLKNDFEVDLDDEAQTRITQAFKFLVVDRLREGVVP